MTDDKQAEAPLAQVGIAARRVQLAAHHVHALFGDGYSLTPIYDLRQPGERACLETVQVRGPSGELRARVVLPLVERTRVELNVREQSALGIEGPLRLSTNVTGSYGCVLAGPHGTVVLAEGVLNAQRQLVVSPEHANALGLAANHSVDVAVLGDRARQFHDVVVRVQENALFELRVDSEDANAIELNERTVAQVLGGARS